MNETNGRNGEKSGIRRLRDLPRDIAPPRDLWPSISAQLDSRVAVPASQPENRRSGPRPTGLQWAAFAAVVSALAVGVWLGRSVLPGSDSQGTVPVVSNEAVPATTPNPPAGTAPAVATPAASDSGQVFASAYVIDPRYVMHREAMVRDLEAKLDALPTESRQKVAASLAMIRDSMKNIEAELGRDPANTLLQQLLVNTYQDEMRVLHAVNEASDAGREL
jgi:hypothetical protein